MLTFLRHRPAWAAACACALALIPAGLAHAESVVLTSTYGSGGFIGTNNGSLEVTINIPANTASSGSPAYNETFDISGAYGWTVSSDSGGDFTPGSSIYTFCIQAAQYFYYPGNSSFTAENLVGSPSGLGAADYGFIDQTAANQIQSLINQHDNPNNSTTYAMASTTNAAAFQMAIWEIEYDGGGATPGTGETFGTASNYFSTGYLTATESAGNVLSLATTWLNAIPNTFAQNLPVTSITLGDSNNNLVQDQIYLIPVPLPPALPVGLATLCGAALLLKLRRGQRSVI